MLLPTSSSAVTQWAVWDYGARVLTSPAAAGGYALVEFPAVPDNELWLVDRMVVQLSPAAGGLAELYIDNADDPGQLIDASYLGDLDVGDFASPHLLQATQRLLVKWPGAADGAFARARMQYTVLRRVQ